MHVDRVTVSDLLQALQACDPDAEVRIAQQPAWPFEDAIDTSNAAVEVELDGTAVVYLSEGTQLGYLPRSPASSSAGRQPTSIHGSE